MNPIVRQIITDRLKADGFDGLFYAKDECACTLNDGLAPCDGIQPDCEAGYEIPGRGKFEGTFEVVRKRGEK